MSFHVRNWRSTDQFKHQLELQNFLQLFLFWAIMFLFFQDLTIWKHFFLSFWDLKSGLFSFCFQYPLCQISLWENQIFKYWQVLILSMVQLIFYRRSIIYFFRPHSCFYCLLVLPGYSCLILVLQQYSTIIPFWNSNSYSSQVILFLEKLNYCFCLIKTFLSIT